MKRYFNPISPAKYFSPNRNQRSSWLVLHHTGAAHTGFDTILRIALCPANNQIKIAILRDNTVLSTDTGQIYFRVNLQNNSL